MNVPHIFAYLIISVYLFVGIRQAPPPLSLSLSLSLIVLFEMTKNILKP